MTVPKGKRAVSAAIVPLRARTPLAVRPIFLGFPRCGPLEITGRPSQFRLYPQHSPQEQYPVTSSTYSLDRAPLEGRMGSQRA